MAVAHLVFNFGFNLVGHHDLSDVLIILVNIQTLVFSGPLNKQAAMNGLFFAYFADELISAIQKTSGSVIFMVFGLLLFGAFLAVIRLFLTSLILWLLPRPLFIVPSFSPPFAGLIL